MAQFSNNIQKLLHPDLMSKEEIIEILTMRCIKVTNIENLDRSELLNIYNRIIMPLEQRPSRHAIKNITEDKLPEKVCTPLPPCRKIRVNSISNGLNEYDKQKKMLKMSDDVDKLNLKRNISSENDTHETPCKKVRQKITWP